MPDTCECGLHWSAADHDFWESLFAAARLLDEAEAEADDA